MRVLLVSPGYPPATGGVERHVEAMAAELVRREHQVTVLALTPSGDRPSHPEPSRPDGVRVVRLATRSLGPFQLPVGLPARLAQLAAEHDVVHVHNYHSPLPLQVLAAVRDRPVLLTPHFHGGGHSPAATLAHLFYRRAFRYLLPRVAGLVFVSAAERARFLVAHPAAGIPNVVIHNGIRESPRPAGPLRRRRLVLAIARLQPYKRVDVLIEAFARLAVTDPDSCCVVVGEGPERPRLERMVREAGLAGGQRVRLPGRVDDDELSELLATARVAVATSAHEAYGMAVMDALAAGVRVVASDIPAHRELAGLTEVTRRRITLWDARSGPAGLKRLIEEALSQPEADPAVPVLLPTWSQAAAALESFYARLGATPAPAGPAVVRPAPVAVEEERSQ